MQRILTLSMKTVEVFGLLRKLLMEGGDVKYNFSLNIGKVENL